MHRCTKTSMLLKVCILWILCIRCRCQTRISLLVPASVDACILGAENHPIDPMDAKLDCLQRLLWYYQPSQNGTVADTAYFSRISERTMRRQAPETGFRTRKEYRTLTDAERDELHTAFNRLYENGTLRRYAELHSRAVKKIHGGPAFLPWYRVFLAHFEEELRTVSSRSVSLPYMDTSLDHEMDNPVNSVLWSSKFLGNGNGRLLNGPFKGWRSAAGYLQRNYAAGLKGRLLSKDSTRNIMNKCNYRDIVYPLEQARNASEMQQTLEYHHQGILDWIGGDMTNPRMAAYDPAFYMHLAFIDYLWELFRRRQLNYCHTDPQWDYDTVAVKPGHGASDLMEGFDKYRNIDGLAQFWTVNWYNYVDHPECPNCGGSEYVYCNTTLNRCVSHSRRTDYNIGKFKESVNASQFGITSEPFEPARDYVPKVKTDTYKIEGPFTDGRSVFTARKNAEDAVLNNKRHAAKTSISKPRIWWQRGVSG